MDTKRHRIVAIICAKKDSKRFPFKNRQLISPVLTKLLGFTPVDKVVIATDDPVIEKISIQNNRLQIMRRKKNCCIPEDSVFKVARWAYLNLDEQYDTVIVILPNVIKFRFNALYDGVRILRENNLNEVRTYDINGVENGVIIMKEDWFMNGNLSVYCGAVFSIAKEVHVESEVYGG